jgi:POT family proton-dependent oligopeptide transporter
MPGDVQDTFAPPVAVARASEEIGRNPSPEKAMEAYSSEDELMLPTHEELSTLRRVSDYIPAKAYTIAFVELCERLSYYGTVQVFVNFIQYDRPGTATGRARDPSAADAQPGFLGMGQRASTGLTTFNQFWVYMLPLFGAYIADTRLGRFRTIWISVLISIAGHCILTGSAAPAVRDRGTGGSMAAFIVGLIIMGIGTGGFKPNISPLIAEQIPHDHMFIKTLKSGERVIVDPAVTLSRVYNW